MNIPVTRGASVIKNVTDCCASAGPAPRTLAAAITAAVPILHVVRDMLASSVSFAGIDLC